MVKEVDKDTVKSSASDLVKSGAGAVPAHIAARMKDDAGKGVSTAAEDSIVPRLYVLQPLSPQVLKQKQEYIKGAEAGDLWLRNASKPIIKPADGIIVQPCHFYRNWVEWFPKNEDGSGGGYVGEFDMNLDDVEHLGLPSRAKKEVDAETGRDLWSDKEAGTEFKDTRNHVVMVYPSPDVMMPYLISLSSTGHTVSRQWMFMMKSKVIGGDIAPSWSCLYRLGSVMRSKGQHNWFVLDPRDAGDDGTCWATERQYVDGKALAEAFITGVKKAEAPVEQDQSHLSPSDSM